MQALSKPPPVPALLMQGTTTALFLGSAQACRHLPYRWVLPSADARPCMGMHSTGCVFAPQCRPALRLSGCTRLSCSRP